MGLTAYQRKRKFGQTPEPKGKKKAGTKELRFVVQKHAASRLHYDFRLELDGVLKSWAVPKGPSLNPADKRLAMMVEDHPYDYRDFEGTIPAGNYGAGSVMVWDEGTYHADGETDPAKGAKLLRAGLKRGDLKFVLHGSKLGGSFALVKTRQSENSWLLIKHRDEAATETDVTKQDKSVKTGRTLEEIAAGAKPRKKGSGKKGRETWQSNRQQSEPTLPKGKEKPPQEVSPMLAKLVDAPFDGDGWLFETKWDGYRAIGESVKGKVKLYSRNGLSFVDHYPPVVEALQKLGHDAVLDGEVIALEKGRSSFQALQNYRRTGKGKLHYAVFDLLFLDGHDLRQFPLRDRKDLLCRLIDKDNTFIYSKHVEGEGVKFYQRAEKKGEEGIIAKKADAKYVSRRTPDWLKIKTHQRQEAVIGGFTEPRGSRKKFGALLLGIFDGDQLRYIGHTGTGFDEATLDYVYQKLKPLARQTSPFSTEPKPNSPVTWVKPELLAEVKFQEWTEEGHMRQPVFAGLREDKEAKTVKREKEVPTQEIVEEVAASAKERLTTVAGHRLKLTNLNKVYWPKEKYTKGDLVDYYTRIGKTILPYLKGRPESLNRHPNGIEGSNFFQKNITDQPPRWVKTHKIFSESNDKDLNWLVCDNQATLVYLANLGCIELNPWHSRVGKLEKPDYLLIDLDAKTAGFKEVVKVAHAVREVLDSLSIQGYPKTSGKTGLHVCVPLGAKYTFEQAKQFTELLMNLVHQQLPDITSVERTPSKREGKIYLDFLQNRKGQTMAAPYCLRPVPGATVSTPLKWEEVNGDLDPRDFTMQTIFLRLEAVGDLWKPVLGKGADLKKALAKLG